MSICPFHIGLVCCSDGIPISDHFQIEALIGHLQSEGFQPVLSPCLYRAGNHIRSGTAKERAEALMNFYDDRRIQAIFDISGGDLANEILPWLDYQTIADRQKQFWGYSDLTTVINAIFSKTGRESVLYQIRNITAPDNDKRREEFFAAMHQGSPELFSFPYHFIQGESMRGRVLGGNIRCLLKLAGTPYWPDMKNAVLFLESRSGTVARMTAFLSQLQQMGVFRQVNGILLGNFTQMEKEQCRPGIEDLIREFTGPDLPVARTMAIGHQTDSAALTIGRTMMLQKQQ